MSIKEESTLKTLNLKYNYPVPRYTSYPPANKFADPINTSEYLALIKESNNWNPQNISVYVHIPFCNKLCHYCGCNSILKKSDDPVAEYVDALISEIKTVSSCINKNRKLSQIHFGGGTPNAIDTELLSKIVQSIHNEFDFIENAEIAIECNPAYLDFEYIDKLIEIGFNRYSFGVQDLDLQVLENINRDAPAMPLSEMISYIKQSSPNASVNLDFIYGLAGQSVESFLRTMKQAAELRPERLVTFSYAHVPWVNQNQLNLEKIGLPSADDKIDMYEKSYFLLKDLGYHPIGLDHYVLESDELFAAAEGQDLHRNFQGYCTRRTTGQVYAFGVSSITQLEKAYIQNMKLTGEYIETIKKGELPVKKHHRLSDEELVIREAINDLMCNKVFDLSKLADNLRLSTEKIKAILKYKLENFDIFAEDGLIIGDRYSFSVTEKGILFIRNIAAMLDPAFEIKEGNYSRSV